MAAVVVVIEHVMAISFESFRDSGHLVWRKSLYMVTGLSYDAVIAFFVLNWAAVGLGGSPSSERRILLV